MSKDNFRSPISKKEKQCNDQKGERQDKMGDDGNVLRSACIIIYDTADSQWKIIIPMTTYDNIV